MRALRRSVIRWICICLAAAMTLLALFRSRYTDVICSLSQTQVSNATSDLINEAVDAQILSGDIQYDRIIYFEKDLEGRITALKTNMSEVNRLKSAILDRVNKEILGMDTETLGIPLGDLVLPELLSGRGPEIPIHILAIRNSDAEFGSRFTQAGINQTLHQLTLQIRVDVVVLVLGQDQSFTVSTQVVVAETVIVGQVPETLLQNGG